MKKEYVVTIILLLAVTYYVSGCRLTPLAAVHSKYKELKRAELIDVYGDQTVQFFLFQNDKKEEFRTVRVDRKLFDYKSNHSTRVAISQDKIQTISGMSYMDGKREGTLFVVRNDDNNVVSIEIETDEGIEQKKVTKGEIVHFQLPYSKQIDHLHAKAYNDKGEEIYYYGYETPNEMNELKWYPVKKKSINASRMGN
ncbi:hypothetical protein [Sporosarcina sp. Te-1]|uniref:hypothetical protein n=1 Tax=Sporosarcina sp. Te-1 TaxID=2818390 RepID=UPI001A9DFF32|nr:hypothetical protein [Sporosarcina sp. Te-1]QTD41937.1 hypothetical protein J3U78_03540 [Sporosarcina sp. Te-1]